ncbi:hypothetical protein [Telmatospirillum sp. J64-1]|uniref:hypothetical protein n=1 Tax=Telmatospirillum sp. J64-1 TaxID=2502183 RepID=UPI00115D1F4F|nr:hypothetical protein [Telmatospirillum sp. J64-1]
MMRYVVAAAAMFGLAHPAAAQQQVCADRKLILESLADEYAEAPTSIGVTNAGNMVEVLTTSDGMTWTILMTMPDGTSCVMAAGEDWMEAPQVAQGPEA